MIQKIDTVLKKLDKKGNPFLIIITIDRENIIVFPRKVNEERWKDLKEGKTYDLTIEESFNNQGNPSKLLKDFKEIE